MQVFSPDKHVSGDLFVIMGSVASPITISMLRRMPDSAVERENDTLCEEISIQAKL